MLLASRARAPTCPSGRIRRSLEIPPWARQRYIHAIPVGEARERGKAPCKFCFRKGKRTRAMKKKKRASTKKQKRDEDAYAYNIKTECKPEEHPRGKDNEDDSEGPTLGVQRRSKKDKTNQDFDVAKLTGWRPQPRKDMDVDWYGGRGTREDPIDLVSPRKGPETHTTWTTDLPNSTSPPLSESPPLRYKSDFERAICDKYDVPPTPMKNIKNHLSWEERTVGELDVPVLDLKDEFELFKDTPCLDLNDDIPQEFGDTIHDFHLPFFREYFRTQVDKPLTTI